MLLITVICHTKKMKDKISIIISNIEIDAN